MVSPGVGLPLLSSPSSLMHEPAGETEEAKERAKGRARERERTEGEANPGTAAQHFHILINPNMNTPIYRKGGNCISKSLSVSKGIPPNISHTHTDTHKHAVRHFPTREKKWTNTNIHTGKAQRDYSLLTTAVEYTHTGIKTQKTC